MKDKIDELAELLASRELDGAMQKVSDYMAVARKLVNENPNLSVEALGQLYDDMCAQAERDMSEEQK